LERRLLKKAAAEKREINTNGLARSQSSKRITRKWQSRMIKIRGNYGKRAAKIKEQRL
jgi:hypothetical protein